MIKQLYHCTPSEVDEQDDFIVSLHSDFIHLEIKHQERERKKNEAKNKLKNKNGLKRGKR